MAAREFLFAPAVTIRDRRIDTLVLALVVGGAALLLLAVSAFDLLLEFGVLVGVLAVAFATLRWPAGAAIFLVAFTPINRFLIFLFFSATGSSVLLRASQLWKDEIVLVLLVRVLFDALQRRTAPRVYFLDLAIVAFLAWNFLYVIYPGTLQDNSLFGRMLGFRIDAYFLFAYFAGRGVTLERKHARLLVLWLIPGSVAVALVAAFQWLLPGTANSFMNSLGFQGFVDAVNGSSDIAVRGRALAGVSIPRASSLLMGDLALAFYQVMLVPLAAGLFFVQRSRRGLILSGLFLLLMIGTMAMSGTRSALLAAPAALAVLTFLTVSYGRAIAIGGIVLLLGGFAFFAAGGTIDFFERLASPTEGSALGHRDAVEDSLDIIREEPLGRGLGTSHTVAFQLGLGDSFANESWYLQIATETGVPGAVLYTIVMLLVSIMPLAAFFRCRDPWLRALTLGVGGAGLGFALVGIVLHVWEAPVIAAAFWLLAGVAVRAPDMEREWEAQEAVAQ
jgi:hypothetical protein